eukprot:Gb_32202 [translate_table: standard]
MGDLQVSPQPNGILTEESSSSVNPQSSNIDLNRWGKAERRTAEIILRIQPTVISEQRRKAVIEYVQRLIQSCVRCEVFTFGSVPLKTYLPDGDIDLTTFSSYPNVDDTWANEVHSVLEREEHSKVAEFKVREVQYIKAEVKLVKCLVENIVVDISFNQLGGLCTLCFLEEVDQLVGKDHLFKRSIILVKAWCYYESRILGAHHGLISTYALETLVLYIFHLFNASLCGPLEVLYRFLDYFSKFDWDNYCVSIQGPVSISSLPEIVAEPPETDRDGLLLSKEFLKTCTDLYSVFPKGQDNQSRSFSPKHLNVIDPLRENNNLGRSVSKGNFYRIRSAFTYGVRKLGKILLSPEETIAEELDKFFLNTLERHGKGQRPDVPDSISLESRLSVESASSGLPLKSDVEDKKHDKNALSFTQEIKAQAAERDVLSKKSLESIRQMSCETSAEGRGTMGEDYRAALSGQTRNDKTLLMDLGTKLIGGLPEVTSCGKHSLGYETGQGISCFSNPQHKWSSKPNSSIRGEGNPVCSGRLAGDAKDLASNVNSGRGISRSKSQGCDFWSSENGVGKALTDSGPTESKLYLPSNTAEKSSTFQGDLSDKCARNGTCNELTTTPLPHCSNSLGLVFNGDDNKSVSVSAGNLVPKINGDGLTTGLISFTDQDAVFEIYEYPERLAPHSVVHTNSTTNVPQGIAHHSTSCEGSIQKGYIPPVKLNSRVPVAVDHPPLSGKQAPSFCFGIPLSVDTSKSLQHPQNDTSLGLNPSHIPRPIESATTNCAVYQPASASFPSADTCKSFYMTQPSTETGASFINMDEGLKDWEGRKSPQSSAVCKDRSNTSSSVIVNGSGVIGSTSEGLSCPGFDLSGDFGTYLSNLEYGKSCQDSGSQGSIMPLPMLSLYVQKQHARKGHAMPIHANMSMLPYVHGYGVAPVRPFLHASGYLGSNPVILPGTFSGDELPKPRSGTGTYIPNPSHRSYKERYSPNRGRSRGAPAQDFTPRVSSQMHRPRSNGRNQATFDSNFQRQTGNKNIDVNSAGVESGDKDRDISRQESLCKSSYQPVSSNTILIPSVGSEAVDIYSLSHMSGHGELSSSTEVNTDGPPVAMRMPHSNALAFPSEQVEFGSFGSVQLGAVSPAVTSEQGRHVDSLVRNGQVSNSGSEAPPAYSSKGILQKPGALSNHQREASKSYHLKEDDFPPLSFQRQHGSSSADAGSNDNANGRNLQQTIVATP